MNKYEYIYIEGRLQVSYLRPHFHAADSLVQVRDGEDSQNVKSPPKKNRSRTRHYALRYVSKWKIFKFRDLGLELSNSH